MPSVRGRTRPWTGRVGSSWCRTFAVVDGTGGRRVFAGGCGDSGWGRVREDAAVDGIIALPHAYRTVWFWVPGLTLLRV